MPKINLRNKNPPRKFITSKQDEARLLARPIESLSGAELDRAIKYAEARLDRSLKRKR